MAFPAHRRRVSFVFFLGGRLVSRKIKQKTEAILGAPNLTHSHLQLVCLLHRKPDPQAMCKVERLWALWQMPKTPCRTNGHNLDRQKQFSTLPQERIHPLPQSIHEEGCFCVFVCFFFFHLFFGVQELYQQGSSKKNNILG